MATDSTPNLLIEENPGTVCYQGQGFWIDEPLSGGVFVRIREYSFHNVRSEPGVNIMLHRSCYRVRKGWLVTGETMLINRDMRLEALSVENNVGIFRVSGPMRFETMESYLTRLVQGDAVIPNYDFITKDRKPIPSSPTLSKTQDLIAGQCVVLGCPPDMRYLVSVTSVTLRHVQFSVSSAYGTETVTIESGKVEGIGAYDVEIEVVGISPKHVPTVTIRGLPFREADVWLAQALPRIDRDYDG